ncbi:chromosome partitioning protein ParB [cyanobacterium TDX16]|nr:chromosome partitioning protein ParB [cyanobacterium TDX16]
MTRRSLKEAVQGSGLTEESNLKAFVFGNNTPAPGITTQAGDRRIVPRTSIHRTFSFTPDRQPVRHSYDREKLKQWAQSDVASNGIQSPLWVRPLPGDSAREYELVAGLRRHLAAEILALDSVPVIVYHWTDEEAFEASLSENTNRQDFSPLEYADGALKLVALKLNCSIDDAVSLLYRMDNEVKGKVTHNVVGSPQGEAIALVFNFLGQSTWKSFVSHYLPLLRKPSEVLEAIRAGRIEYTKGLEIAKEKDPTNRRLLLEAAINERLSLSAIRERMKPVAPSGVEPTLQHRFADTYKRVKQAKVWHDPKKAKELEKLLARLELLIQQE